MPIYLFSLLHLISFIVVWGGGDKNEIIVSKVKNKKFKCFLKKKKNLEMKS